MEWAVLVLVAYKNPKRRLSTRDLKCLVKIKCIHNKSSLSISAASLVILRLEIWSCFS